MTPFQESLENCQAANWNEMEHPCHVYLFDLIPYFSFLMPCELLTFIEHLQNITINQCQTLAYSVYGTNIYCLLQKPNPLSFFIFVHNGLFKKVTSSLPGYVSNNCECTCSESSLIYIYITMLPLETTGAYVTGLEALWRCNKRPDRGKANKKRRHLARQCLFTVCERSLKMFLSLSRNSYCPLYVSKMCRKDGQVN